MKIVKILKTAIRLFMTLNARYCHIYDNNNLVDFLYIILFAHYTFICKFIVFKEQDPVVQSIVSLTISLRHKFVKQISAKVTNTLLFFVEKM